MRPTDRAEKQSSDSERRTNTPNGTTDSAATRLVDVENVAYRYPGRSEPALGGLSLTVDEGEIVAVVGPSGCGKSTLLRLTSGLAEPDTGQVRIAPPTAGRHRCAMLFQEDTLLPWMKVKDNARLNSIFTSRRAGGLLRPKRAADDLQLLRMVGLEQSADLYPYQLSGGMKRRLALVTAVASSPQLLLLDEPFSALDEPTRVEIHGEVHAILQKYRIASLLVTHDIAEAICLADRIVVLSNGPASTVAEQFSVPFKGTRDMMTLRSSTEFLELYGQIWETLSALIEQGRSSKN